MSKSPWADRTAEELRNGVDSLSVRRLREMAALLESSRRELVRRLSYPASPGTSNWLRAALRETDEIIAELEARIKLVTDGVVTDASVIGEKTARKSIERIARRVGAGRLLISSDPAMSLEQIAIWSDFQLDLIRAGITQPVKVNIQNALRVSWASGRSPFDVMRELEAEPFGRLSFKSKFHRAEAIVRTESGRVANMANQAASERAAEKIADWERLMGREPTPILKKWLSARDERVRATHKAADAAKPIPLDEFYEVGGEKCLHPNDARLSAKESVNCRCVSITVAAGEEI